MTYQSVCNFKEISMRFTHTVSTVVLKEGSVSKRAKVIESHWLSRWAVLTNTELRFYDQQIQRDKKDPNKLDEETAEEMDSINLKDISSVVAASDSPTTAAPSANEQSPTATTAPSQLATLPSSSEFEPYTVVITTTDGEGETHYMRAGNQQERDAWIQAISQQYQYLQSISITRTKNGTYIITRNATEDTSSAQTTTTTKGTQEHEKLLGSLTIAPSQPDSSQSTAQ
jgi:hypothetical protein